MTYIYLHIQSVLIDLNPPKVWGAEIWHLWEGRPGFVKKHLSRGHQLWDNHRYTARLIDTAQIYSNHEDIAEACWWSGIGRVKFASFFWLVPRGPASRFQMHRLVGWMTRKAEQIEGDFFWIVSSLHDIFIIFMTGIKGSMMNTCVFSVSAMSRMLSRCRVPILTGSSCLWCVRFKPIQHDQDVFTSSW